MLRTARPALRPRGTAPATEPQSRQTGPNARRVLEHSVLRPALLVRVLARLYCSGTRGGGRSQAEAATSRWPRYRYRQATDQDAGAGGDREVGGRGNQESGDWR